MLNHFQRRILFAIIGLIVGAYFFTGCGEKGNQPVVRVGGRVISVKKFEDSFSRGKAKNILAKSTLEDKIAHLNKMIDKELQIVDAYRKKLDQDEEVKKQLETRGEVAILRRLIDKVIIDPNIPESEIKKYYKKSKKQVKISEIIIKMSSKPSEQEQKAIDNKLNYIMNELKNGADFSDLIKKYSQDKSMSQPGRGSKGLLSWTPMSAKEPITQKAFSMKVGEYSDPVKTRKGYSIIKVTDITNVEVKPYADEKMRIKQEILRTRGKELEEKYFKYLSDLKAKDDTQFHEDNIDKFIEAVNRTDADTSKEAKPQPPMDPKAMFNKFNDAEKELSLVSYNGGKITIGKLVEDLSQFPITRRPRLTEAKDLNNLLDKRVLPRELLKLEAEKKNIKNDKEVKKQLKSFRESFMLSKIKKMEVSDKVNITDDDLKKYFEEHREEFKNQEKREVQEIFVKDAKLAEKIAALAKAGQNFTRLAKKYNEKASTKPKNGNLGFIKRSRQHIGKPAFELEIGGIAGPIKVGNNYSIIKLLNIQEQSYKTFEDSKRFIKSKVNKLFRENREKEWMDALRKEIEITIYENRLQKTFSNLKSES